MPIEAQGSFLSALTPGRPPLPPSGYRAGLESSLLADSLAVAVMIALADLATLGGPNDEDMEWAREQVPFGEEVLYRVPGRSGPAFARLARCLAIMAHLPGGVRLFGHHWQVCQGGVCRANNARSAWRCAECAPVWVGELGRLTGTLAGLAERKAGQG